MIVSYSIQNTTIQSDGTQRTVVAFIDHLAEEHVRSYDLPSGATVGDELDARQPVVESLIEEQEENVALSDVVDGGADPLTKSFDHSTIQKFIRRLIRYGMKSRDVRVVLILKPVIDYLEGSYTAAQIANYLNTTIAVLARIKTRVNAIYAIKSTLDADEALLEEVE